MIFSTLLQGFGVGGSLLVAIGPQNAFVINQGLKREHVFITALICTLIDTFLIALGVLGLGEIFQLHPMLIKIARFLGASFLTIYGLMSFKSAFHPVVFYKKNIREYQTSTLKLVSILFGLSFLNPHVYLDTVVLIGSLSAQHLGVSRYFFGIGASLASLCWFYGIAYGSRVLTPLFEKAIAWRILDIIVGVFMLLIALMLIIPVL